MGSCSLRKGAMNDLLAYLHPVMQVLVLVIAVATLRLGLALKNHRLQARLLEQRHGVMERHVQLGWIFLVCLSAGYGVGLLSMWLFRGQALFRSAHFFFGTLALLLFLAGGYMGWLLHRGTRRHADVRDVHGFLAYLGLFVSLGVAVMGFILLP